MGLNCRSDGHGRKGGLLYFYYLSFFGYLDVAESCGAELFGKGFLRLILAVNEQHLLHLLRFLALVEVNHLAAVGVSGETVKFGYLCADGMHLTEDGNLFQSGPLYACAERDGRAVTYDKDGASRVVDMVGDMLLDASRLEHARRGDDDRGLGVGVEAFAVLHLAYVGECVESEGVGVGLHDALDVIVHLVEVVGEDTRGVDGEGAVNIHLDAVRQESVVVEVVKHEDYLLGTSDGEGGYDEFSSACDACVINQPAELLLGLHVIRVQAVAVCGFGDEDVALWEGGVAPDEAVVRAAHVACESEASGLAVGFLHGEVDDGGTEHMTRTGEAQGGVLVNLEVTAVGHRSEEVHTAVGVAGTIERCSTVFLVLALHLLVEPLNILLLYVRTVGEHDGAEVARLRCANDAPSEAHTVDVRDEA